MIPKTIHYCWFGKKAIPPELKKNIESWKKYLPDYKIVRWDETNFDIRCNKFVEGAYRAKKYAFVSDFARFAILNQSGGIYFDTDVEVLRPLDDILVAGPYMGRENKNRVATGLGLAMEPGMAFLREMEELYNQLKFRRADENEKTITVVEHVTNLLVRYGFDPNNEAIQNVCGINIYPVDYFCPQNYRTGIITMTENTRTIHHFTASWQSPAERLVHSCAVRLRRKHGEKGLVPFLEWGLHYCRRFEEKSFKSMVKTIVKKTFRIQKH